VPFLEEMNDCLKAQLEELSDKRENEKRQAGYVIA
jgi:hypothetical protein